MIATQPTPPRLFSGSRGDAARAKVECALVQAALWGPDSWAPILRDILTFRDLRDYVNLMTWRALLLGDGDLVKMGNLLRPVFSQSTWECWGARYCGGFDTFLTVEPPVEEMFELIRSDDDEALIEFCSRWKVWE